MSRPSVAHDRNLIELVDGTTNFVHGYPFVCISLGLIYKQRPVLGVIYNPFLDYLVSLYSALLYLHSQSSFQYTGIKSQGSYLTRNAKEPVRLPLAASKPLPSLSHALIAVEWGSDRNQKTMEAKSGSYKKLAADGTKIDGGKMAHSLRSMGSAALNFAMVAQGGLDIYWWVNCRYPSSGHH